MKIKHLKYFLIIVIPIFFFSCNQSRNKNLISGTWIFENEINLQNLNDSTDLHEITKPIIYDFKENGTLIFKNYDYANKDTIYKRNWKIESNKIYLDNQSYIIQKLNENKLVILDYTNGIDTLRISLTRAKEISINYNKKEIKKILTSKLWTLDSLQFKNITNFNFLDNGKVIYRIKHFDNNYNGIKNNLISENWGITKHENFYFLYTLGGLSNNHIYQIVDFSSDSFQLSNFYNSEKSKFQSKDLSNINLDLIQENIKGN